MGRRFHFYGHDFSIEKVTTIKGFYRAAALYLLFVCPMLRGQDCNQWKPAVRVGELQAQLKEASGVAASRTFPGRLYHIDDSGDTGNFYVTGMDGRDTKTIRVAGFDPVDTEAVSLGRCPGGRGSCLYIGDIGDNDAKRKSIEVIVVDEAQNFPQSVKPRARLKMRYPDRPHDAESMAVHPDGTIFILTKERPARLFKANPSVSDQTLTAVTTLDAGSKPTDMAISDDGKRVLVLTYTDAFEYGIDWKQLRKITLNFLQQQESVTYLPGSRSFIYTTEQLLPGLAQWIMRVDCER
jgi:hypothetical protein